MPYLISTSFADFLKKITIDGDLTKLANTRRDRIGELLGTSFNILNISTIGSIPRGTGLKNVSDVDVMVELHYDKHIKGKSPRTVLENVRDALSEYNAQIVKKNGQAVTLYFKTWPNVDIVPAKRVTIGSGYALHIPDMNSGEWIVTNPGVQNQTMTAASLRKRQLVRMVKCWNHAHSNYLQSFHIEQIALKTWLDESTWNESSWPWALVAFFDMATNMTGPQAELSPAYSVDDWVQLRERLRRAKELSSIAWYAVDRTSDVKTAVERYRILLGDRFPQYG